MTKVTEEEKATRIYRGDLVELCIVSSVSTVQLPWAPKTRFKWVRNPKKVVLDCCKVYTGIVVEKYRVSQSLHTIASTVCYPTAKPQPGRKQKLVQHNETFFAYHILLGDEIIYLDSRALAVRDGTYTIELKLLLRGEGSG